MNSDIEEFLDMVDQWKFKAYQRLKRMTPAQRRSHWNKIHEDARKLGLNVVNDPTKAAKRQTKRVRRTG